MSNVFTLEDLENEIQRKYEPLVFRAGEQDFVLVSLMRVTKKVRAEVQTRLQALGDSEDENATVSEDDTLETLKFVLSSVTKDNKGRALVKVLGDDLVKYTTLMEQWQKATQPGEASSSPS
jgi:hypothetical protein